MSGAGHIKFDGSTDDLLYEVKTASKTFQLSANLLNELWRRAMREDKEPMMMIEFGDGLQAMVWVPKPGTPS